MPEEVLTDLQATERCARAMGFEVKVSKDTKGREHVMRRRAQDHMQDHWEVFDPLHDDAQALAVVKKLALNIWPQGGGLWAVGTKGHNASFHRDLNHAIVEAAAHVTPS